MLSLESTYPPAYQLALDMLKVLNGRHRQVQSPQCGIYQNFGIILGAVNIYGGGGGGADDFKEDDEVLTVPEERVMLFCDLIEGGVILKEITTFCEGAGGGCF